MQTFPISRTKSSLGLNAIVPIMMLLVGMGLASHKAIAADCNSNGFDDIAEIAAGTAIDCDANGLPDDCEEAPRVLYVDDSATNGLNDGSSWVDAYVHLQDALADAEANCLIREIWVAAGTYTPDQGGGETPGDREASFQLQNNLALYGGFAGNEDTCEERDPVVNETILSGDLIGDDEPVSCSNDLPDCQQYGSRCVDNVCIVWGNNNENGYCVVTGSGTDRSATLSGFTITGGKGTPLESGGSGMCNITGSPTVTQCTFRGNWAIRAGGGMFNEFGNPLVVNCRFVGNAALGGPGGGIGNQTTMGPTIIECTFVNNWSTSGGAIGNTQFARAVVQDCKFTNNSAGDGGAIFNYYYSEPNVVNSTFIANAADNGGAIANYNASTPVVAGCTFFQNSAASGSVIFNFMSGTSLTNCILWRNVPSQIEVVSGPAEAKHSIIQGGWSESGGIGVIDADPMFANTNGADGIRGTLDDDLRLLPGSPAIDAGSNGAVPVGTLFDLAGSPRFIDDPATVDTGLGIAPIVDMGAYEFQSGDCDGDGDIDLVDVATFEGCLMGTGVGLTGSCGCFDLDLDWDVDLRDFAALQHNIGMQ